MASLMNEILYQAFASQTEEKLYYSHTGKVQQTMKTSPIQSHTGTHHEFGSLHIISKIQAHYMFIMRYTLTKGLFTPIKYK